MRDRRSVDTKSKQKRRGRTSPPKASRGKKKFNKFAPKTKVEKERYFTKEDIFISRMASILMEPKQTVKGRFSQRSVTAMRINNLAGPVEEIKSLLTSKGVELDKVEWMPNAYIVNNMDKSELGKLPEYSRGLFYIQNLSSMLPVLLLEPEEKQSFLDMCAAPGSKTTLIAAMTDNKADITANEDDFRRLGKLQTVLRQFHVDEIRVHKGDGRHIGNDFKQYFDKVLLDAPCSGEGLIYLKGEKPLRFWSIKKISTMIRLQKDLIVSGFDALKPGGSMIYSTCTLEPDENEGVVQHLLKTRTGSSVVKIDPEEIDGFADFKKHATGGITKWSGKSYGAVMKKCLRILPSSTMQGFFIAKIKKDH